jgi:hypothetical protein
MVMAELEKDDGDVDPRIMQINCKYISPNPSAHFPILLIPECFLVIFPGPLTWFPNFGSDWVP